jgi:hypothetical protein
MDAAASLTPHWADPNQVNDAWLKPRIGHAEMIPTGAFEAGSYASLTIIYTAGYFGIDDTGAVRLVTRFATDMGRPQFNDPRAPNFVSVEASNGAQLELRFDPKGHIRPWDRTISIRVLQGFLREGDTLTIRLGDRRQGSPGIRMQTFAEKEFQLKLFVDPIATGIFTEVPSSPRLDIAPGKPVVWKAVLPTGRRVGATFRLCLKAEDRWGNPAPMPNDPLRLSASKPLSGLPDIVAFENGSPVLVIEDLTAAEAGDLTISVFGEEDRLLAVSNPMRIVEAAPLLPYWGDLHGQSEETIGTASALHYFHFARDLAFLDVVGHQGNDFQITRGFYDTLNELTRSFDSPGRFVTLPGYEWSGNTGLGGDRNVYFADENSAIHRSSHALVSDQKDVDTDCTSAIDLFRRLEGYDAVVNAHVGGRYADVRIAHDGRIERSMEIHSAWGTFEWLLYDALDMGYRVGIVCNSDDHKGRPGASFPGASTFGAYGGLTCLLLPELTRAAAIDCLRRRHHYGTTGNRMVLDVRFRFDNRAERFDEDPALGRTSSRPVREATMGDILRSADREITLILRVLGSAPIERIELRRGREVLETFRPYATPMHSRRLRVLWEGAEYRGRGRQTIWDGSATVRNNAISEVRRINFWNPDKRIEREGDNLEWEALTTGNFGGFDLMLRDPRAGRLEVLTEHANLDLPIARIGAEPVICDAGGLARKLSVRRLPEQLTECKVDLERRLPLADSGDSPLYVSVVQEDGYQAWSSPIYLIP